MRGPGRAAWVALPAALLCGIGASAQAGKAARLPVLLDHNRILVEVLFQRKDGSLRKAEAWVDTGNPALVLGGPLAQDLGLEWSAQPPKAPEEERDIPAPAGMRFGTLPLPLDGVACSVVPGARYPFPGVLAEANLPSTVMRRFDVLFDYPGRAMTLAAPGRLQFRGTRVPCLADPKTGIVQVEVRVGGETLSFALDNGASYTLVPEGLVQSLGKSHPEWATHRGLMGCANMWGMKAEPEWPMVRLGEIQVGPVRVSGAGASGLPEGLFEWYSQKTAAPVSGLLGPNVLRAFRVGIDFAGGAVFLDRALRDDPRDMDLVGLTLRPNRDGTFEVIGAAGGAGALPGDVLLRVGALDVKGLSMGRAVDALRGRPGEKRHLTLERAGKTLTVEATVLRHL